MKDNLNKLTFPSYFTYQKIRLANVAKVLMLVGALFVLGFMALDYMLYPEHFALILPIRLAVIITLLLLFLLYSKWDQEKHFSLLSVSLTLISFLMFFYMNLIVKEKNTVLVLITVFYLMGSISLSALIEKKHLLVAGLIIILATSFLVVNYSQTEDLATQLLPHLISLTVFTVLISFKFIDSAKNTYAVARKSHDLQFQDELTGIYNRKGILQWCKERYDKLGANDSFSLIMIDLDHFKEVNDQYGHVAGDKIIAQVAQSINMACDSQTAVGRLGGEEFLVAIEGSQQTEVEKFAHDLLQTLRNTLFDLGNGQKLQMFASLGVAHHQGEDFQKLLITADRHMYAAKGKGRNQVVTKPSIESH